MEELNYPIKYAILGIEEQVGWAPGLHEMERDYDICGYIVSKVYVVSETINYNINGTGKKSYQVVFPFISIADREKQIPKYNIYYECYNSIYVPNIFDSFDDAKSLATQKNRELRSRSYLPVSFGEKMTWSERILKGQEQFDEKIKKYLEFEQYIYNETADMKITLDENIKTRIKK